MSEPVRIQLRRVKGWRMPPNTLSVARPGRWGNPFQATLVGEGRAVKAFSDLMRGFFSGPSFSDLTDAQFSLMYRAVAAFQKRIGAERRRAAIDELRGKNLACWCATTPGTLCHADVLLKLANAPLSTEALTPAGSGEAVAPWQAPGGQMKPPQSEGQT